jgi:hypothetical protein
MLYRNFFKPSLFFLAFLLVIHACSTEKDALLSRWYHQVNTKYNGYFNANELIKEALKTYNDSRKEDYSNLLTVESFPDEKEAQGMYPALDTAISKCKKLIAKHSMPSIATGRKTDEYNKWMDNVWLTIGKSKFIKHEYEDAFKNFEYIRKFFKDDPASLWGSLWIIKTDLAVGDIRKAEILMKKIEKDVEDIKAQTKEKQEGGSKSKSKSKLIRKLNKSHSSKDEGPSKPMKLDKDFEYELFKTKAIMAIYRENYTDAQKFIAEALKQSHFKNRLERPRLFFLLAQLSVINGDAQNGIKSYTKVIKNSIAKYDMVFAARINRAMAAGSIGQGKIRKELNKMLKDPKNFEFKDQIYYALGDIEQSAGNRDLAINNFSQSVFYSINNNRQKGQSYERMGDICFQDKKYLKAQKYYDSCISVVPENYKHFDLVKNKADKLKDLAIALETVALEDSLQKIAQLSPEDQEKFMKKALKQIQDEKERQAALQAARLAQLQEIQNRNKGNDGGGKWYFYDQKQRDKGFQDFKSIWGQRPLEDDWRRSNKVVLATFTEEDTSAVQDSTLATAPTEDSLTVESLLAKVPKGDSAIAASKVRLMNALYTSGRIYHEELNEDALAIQQFTDLLARKIENPNNLLALYELYKIYLVKDASKADYYKNELLNNYPNSDFANYIRDPDYFIKQKERGKIDLEDYEKSIDRYNSGLYGLVKSKAELVITSEPNNPYRSKYMLLYVLAKGQYTENKKELLPDLEKLQKEYPNTPESARAKEMADIINNGYSKEIEANFGKANVYDYNATDPVFLVIILPSDSKMTVTKTNISNFNREFFSLEHYKTQGSQLKNGSPIVLVREFETEVKAKKYLETLNRTKKYDLEEVMAYQKFLITTTNYAKLITTGELNSYLQFYKDFYK